jgi:hypothetical protein
MRYAEFEQSIERTVAAASADACRRFALDTIRLLHGQVESATRAELTSEEQQWLSSLIVGVEAESPGDLASTLEALNESMCHDPVRAIEFHPGISELLCAIDNWIGYRRTAEPRLIAGVAINMVNALDYAIRGDVGEYSIDNMLGATEMVAEFQRQQRLLASA